MRVACSTGCVLAFKLMVLLQLQALPAQDHRRVVGHVQRGLQQEPAGSAGALADFVGQRIYFTNGNAPCPLGSQPIVDAMSCIEGADETIDVPSVCGGTLLSECVQRRNESLLPKGCFTLEYLGVVSLVLNPGGGETLTCQQPAFCDNICVKLPPEPPTTTLPVTVTHSTMTYTATTSISTTSTRTTSSQTQTSTGTLTRSSTSTMSTTLTVTSVTGTRTSTTTFSVTSSTTFSLSTSSTTNTVHTTEVIGLDSNSSGCWNCSDWDYTTTTTTVTTTSTAFTRATTKPKRDCLDCNETGDSGSRDLVGRKPARQAPTSYQLSTAAPLGKQVPSTTVTTTTVTTTALSDGEDSDAISSTGDQINADSDDSDATPRGDQTEHGHQPQVKTSPSNSPRSNEVATPSTHNASPSRHLRASLKRKSD
mmetsp:Transcript_129155/g.306481  ORF Transcript_129155/g.306481 Transcript_129155/m.306481 type:complete len:422 (+) Transcript_129155:44-1309(+)